MKKSSLIIVVLLIIILLSAGFIVPEGYKAIIVHRDKTSVFTPGLHFKLPLVEKEILLDIRPQLLLANGSSESPYLSVQSFDKHTVELGYAASYEITDALLFYKADKQEPVLTKLQNLLNKNLGEDLVLLTLPQLLQINNSAPIINNVLAQTNKALNENGVKVNALTIDAVNVGGVEKPLWLNQMQTNQDKNLAKLSEKAQTFSENLRQATDIKVANVLAHGKQDSDAIRTQADLDATEIYAKAYYKDPEFYEFYHNLQLYKKLLNSRQDTLILSTHTPFFAALAQGSNDKREKR